jgi:Transposase DDE domain
MAERRPPIEFQAEPPSSLQGKRWVQPALKLIQRLHDVGTQRDHAGNRKLFSDHYATLLLMYFCNPALASLRALQQATGWEKTRQALGIERTSLGSLSEAARIFDAESLRPIVQELAAQAVPLATGREVEALKGLTTVDGSIFAALPRMAWALWLDAEHRGVKLHLHFDVLKGVPADATLTPAACSEGEALAGSLQPDCLHVVDRGYVDYELFAKVVAAKSSLIARVKDNTAFVVQEERPLTAAVAAGVVRDVVISRRSHPGSGRGREGHSSCRVREPERASWRGLESSNRRPRP